MSDTPDTSKEARAELVQYCTADTAATLERLNKALGPFDPIADAEADGRKAFADGLTLQEAVAGYDVDRDLDSGMAFVVAYKKLQAAESGKQAATEWLTLECAIEDYGIDVNAPESGAFIDAFNENRRINTWLVKQARQAARTLGHES